MSGTWKMCISQTIIILGMAVMCLSSTLWLQVIGIVVVFIGSYIGQNILSNVELKLYLYKSDYPYKLDYPLDKS